MLKYHLIITSLFSNYESIFHRLLDSGILYANYFFFICALLKKLLMKKVFVATVSQKEKSKFERHIFHVDSLKRNKNSTARYPK